MIPLSKLDHLEVSGMDIYIYIISSHKKKSIPWNESFAPGFRLSSNVVFKFGKPSPDP